MRWALLFTGIGTILIAVVAGILVSRSLAEPVRALAESATRMSGGDLTVRAPSGGAGDIGQLADQFNRMAERLQASFSALSAERDALQRFIADASHELRTPITALHSFIELMQGPAANDSAARDEFLNESQVQVRRMEWITNNLLDLSRLDAGLIQLHQEECSLADLLQSAATAFLPTAQEKGIDLQISAQPQVTVCCDTTRMQMVLSNLLDNALKFTPPGGNVVLRGETCAGGVQISVRDSGSGISAEDLPHIFERFYRGKTTEKGSGLGLSIVHSILQAHGGSIHVDSQPGQGSLFTLTLRRAPER
jgi:signal transduction histidine kinase